MQHEETWPALKTNKSPSATSAEILVKPDDATCRKNQPHKVKLSFVQQNADYLNGQISNGSKSIMVWSGSHLEQSGKRREGKGENQEWQKEQSKETQGTQQQSEENGKRREHNKKGKKTKQNRGMEKRQKKKGEKKRGEGEKKREGKGEKVGGPFAEQELPKSEPEAET